jgi:hypothetical protein
VAAGDVDDREAAHAEQQLIVDVRAFVIRPAMQDGAAHARQQRRIRPARAVETQQPIDPAHFEIRAFSPGNGQLAGR